MAPEIAESDGAIYYPILYAGIIVCFCLLASLLISLANFNEDTEDHYYVENVSRTQFILIIIFLIPMTFLWHYWCIPDTVTSGVEEFASFFVKDAAWYHIAWCSVFGLFAGFFICLLSEYFTSMNCPPS